MATDGLTSMDKEWAGSILLWDESISVGEGK